MMSASLSPSSIVHYIIIIIIVVDKAASATTRMVQSPATATIEYVAACCRTRTKTKTVRGAYARSLQVQCVYEPYRLSVPRIVA